MEYEATQSTMSKFLSMLLRHHPEFLDLHMDECGWVRVDELLDRINHDRVNKFHLSNLRYIVKTDDKQRFELSFRDGIEYIRAQYGHSICGIDLGYEEVEPPEFLYHGTATKYIDKIQEYGVLSRGRQFVHLTENKKQAVSTGARHGDPVVLKVHAKKLYNEMGAAFYKTQNGIWLTKYIEPEFFEQDSLK